MTIRNAQPSDAPAIQGLLAQLGYPGLRKADVQEKIAYYSREGYALFVAETGGTVAGFISLHSFDIFHSPGKIGRISAFCVDEQARSIGIGMTLLLKAEGFFSEHGCTKIEVTSNMRRTRTHEFYLRHGYTEDSRRFTKYLKGTHK